jgi:hypothetical protein
MARSIGIRVYKGDELVDTQVFERDIIKIGRLASAHLRLEDPKVSRIHAVIDIAANRDEVSIIDMGSAEGTRLNGDKISRARLKNGDEVGLGESRLVVVLDASEVAVLAGGEPEPEDVEIQPAMVASSAATDADAGSGDDGAPVDAAQTDAAPADGSDTQAAIAGGALADLESPASDSGVFAGADVDEAQQTELPADGQGVFAGDEESAPAAAAPVPAPSAAHSQPPASFPMGPPMGYAPLPPIPEDPITPENRHIEIGLRWGGTVVEVKRVREVPSFSIGVEPTDDLFVPLEEVADTASFDLVQQRKGSAEWVLRFTSKMSGTVTRGGQTVPLSESGAVMDGDAYALVMTDDMRVDLAIGYFTLEVRPVSKSKVVPVVPIFDMLFINTALVTLFASASLMSVLLLLPVGLDDGEDDLTSNMQQFQTVIMKKPKQNNFLEKFTQQKAAAKAAAKSSGKAGSKKTKTKTKGRMAAKAPKDKPTDEEVVAAKLKNLFGGEGNTGIAALFADNSGGALNAALGGISGARVGDAMGSGGLGIRGSGPGGGGTATGTLGIGRVGTLGRGTGNAAYGAGTGNLGKKVDRDVKISQGRPIIMGSLDKEIIRRVVREHMAQIRYCYEKELTRTPGIYGKIVMKWIINGNGKVTQAKVAQTQMKNKNVENCMARKIRTWRFPKPKGGGIVIVNYPFVFKQSS